MSSKIQAKSFYLKKLRERAETDIRLADANIDLLSKKEARLLADLDELRANKSEWLTERKATENKLQNPDPVITGWLRKDFQGEVSLRKRGGDPEMAQRLGEPIYGLKYKTRNRRVVQVPKRISDSNGTRYALEDVEIVDKRDNQQAFREWERYMEKGFDIDPEWNFETLFAKVESFLRNAPDLERYGEPYTVYEKSGERYEPATGA